MRTRLLVLVLLLLVPAFLLLLLGNTKRKRSEKALARDRAVSTAKLAAANESYYVRQSRQQLATITQFPLVLMQDRALTEKGLKSLKRLQTDFHDFGLVDSNGTVFCHTLGSNATQTISSSLFRKVVATRDFSGSIFHFQNTLLLQFGYPVFRADGQITRVMYASLKGHLLSDSLTNIFLPEGGVATVFDPDGHVLARKPDLDGWLGKQVALTPFFQEATKQRDGIFEAAGLDGVERLYAVSTVSDRNIPVLLVTVGFPKRDAFAQADDTFAKNLIFAALSVILLSALAWWYSHRFFLRPAKAIVAAAEQLDQGNLNARTGLSPGKSELHKLATSFDKMAASLEKRQMELEQANLEIKSHNEQLEERVAGRTSELKMVNEELESFSYSVSHDLRAPLRHMHGFAQMLLQNPKIKEDDRAQHQLSVIVAAAHQMATLIDNLLSFCRMRRQSLETAEVDFSRLVADIVAEIAAREPERRIDWKIDPLPDMQGDGALLRQVWINLISNAVKYTRERKPAIISISARNEGRDTVFSVGDNGAGFDMAYANKLFGVFERLHHADEFEGTGIGLATVRRIVARHGGRTWAEGKVGHGATFFFTLPNSVPPVSVRGTPSNLAERHKQGVNDFGVN